MFGLLWGSALSCVFLILLLCLFQYEYDHNAKGDRVVLGKGTYGIVYAGRDLSNQVRIAIKEIPEKDSRQVRAGHPRCHLPPAHPDPVPATAGAGWEGGGGH